MPVLCSDGGFWRPLSSGAPRPQPPPLLASQPPPLLASQPSPSWPPSLLPPGLPASSPQVLCALFWLSRPTAQAQAVGPQLVGGRT